MIDHSFDALARQSASALNRRASLKVLGTTAMIAAVARPSLAQAKNKTAKKIKRKAKRKAQQRCLAQVEQCQTFLTATCANVGDPEQCVVVLTPCCDFFGSCNAAGFFLCLNEASQNA